MPAMDASLNTTGGDRRDSTATPNTSFHRLSTSFMCRLALDAACERTDRVTVVAAALFIDISGYSKLATTLTQSRGGAFALSAVVNAFLAPILLEIQRFGGDVVKFAGDAIVVVWTPKDLHRTDDGREAPPQTAPEATEDPNSAMRSALLLRAARCALSILASPCARLVIRDIRNFREDDAATLFEGGDDDQHDCEGPNHGGHAAADPSKDAVLTLHMAVSVGTIDSDIFYHHPHCMQRRYHFVSGPPLRDVSELVDVAGAGEVAIARTMFERYLSRSGAFEAVDPTKASLSEATRKSARLLKRTEGTIEAGVGAWEAQGTMKPPEAAAVVSTAREFIPPAIEQKMDIGINPFELPEMRLVTILFIHMTTREDAFIADWFSEVQKTCDDFDCPVVQVLDDDKGVHVIAAMDLFSLASNRASARTNDVPSIKNVLRLCHRLRQKQLQCSVGVAQGVVFSGVVGNEDVACRWDITGDACVRACRLMQHAVTRFGASPTAATTHDINDDDDAAAPFACVLDESIMEAIGRDASLLTKAGTVTIKGNPDPLPFYELPPDDRPLYHFFILHAPRLSRVCDDVHVLAVASVAQYVSNGPNGISVVFVTGEAGCGKLTVAMRGLSSAGFNLMVPCGAAGQVSLGGTDRLSFVASFAKWFTFDADPQVRKAAERLQSAHDHDHLLHTTRLFFALVKLLIMIKGRNVSIIVKHGQMLDTTSLSLLTHLQKTDWYNGETTHSSSPVTPLSPKSEGRSPSGTPQKSDTGRSPGKFAVVVTLNATPGYPAPSLLRHMAGGPPLVHVDPLNPMEMSVGIEHRLGWRCDPALERIIMNRTGGVISDVDHFIGMIQRQRPYITKLTEDGVVAVAVQDQVRLVEMPWAVVSPSKALTTSQAFNRLSTSQQRMLKVLAIATQQHPSLLRCGLKALRFATVAQYVATKKKVRRSESSAGSIAEPSMALQSTHSMATAAEASMAIDVGLGGQTFDADLLWLFQEGHVRLYPASLPWSHCGLPPEDFLDVPETNGTAADVCSIDRHYVDPSDDDFTQVAIAKVQEKCGDDHHNGSLRFDDASWMVEFASPAMRDVVYATCPRTQVRVIAKLLIHALTQPLPKGPTHLGAFIDEDDVNRDVVACDPEVVPCPFSSETKSVLVALKALRAVFAPFSLYAFNRGLEKGAMQTPVGSSAAALQEMLEKISTTPSLEQDDVMTPCTLFILRCHTALRHTIERELQQVLGSALTTAVPMSGASIARTAQPMAMVVVQVKNWQPDAALGPLAGPVLDLVWGMKGMCSFAGTLEALRADTSHNHTAIIEDTVRQRESQRSHLMHRIDVLDTLLRRFDEKLRGAMATFHAADHPYSDGTRHEAAPSVGIHYPTSTSHATPPTAALSCDDEVRYLRSLFSAPFETAADALVQATEMFRYVGRGSRTDPGGPLHQRGQAVRFLLQGLSQRLTGAAHFTSLNQHLLSSVVSGGDSGAQLSAQLTAAFHAMLMSHAGVVGPASLHGCCTPQVRVAEALLMFSLAGYATVHPKLSVEAVLTSCVREQSTPDALTAAAFVLLHLWLTEPGATGNNQTTPAVSPARAK